MRDDAVRTPAFEEALRRRLAGTAGVSVVDVGTGPFALLAIAAAKLGAEKVRVALSVRTAAVERSLHRPEPDILCLLFVAGVRHRGGPQGGHPGAQGNRRSRAHAESGGAGGAVDGGGVAAQGACCAYTGSRIAVPPRRDARLDVSILILSVCGVWRVSCPVLNPTRWTCWWRR